jgi:hypothetical protein
MNMKSLIRSATVRASVALAFGLSFTAPSFAQLASGVDVSTRLEKAHASMQEIHARAERVNDINTLRNLQHQYGYYVDEALWDEVADMFTNDGTMELGLNGVYVGKESIRKYLYSLTRGKPGLQHGELNTHFQLSPVITLSPDGKSAKGWKIKKLHFFVKFYAPYEGGWTKAPKESALRYGKSRIRPDRPTTVKYQPYPAKFTVPFHYENPVTSAYKPHSSDVTSAALKKAETLAELEAQVRALELQVERMQAIDEIENLEGAYGYYVDKSMQDAIAGMFAEESTLEILGRGVFIGRDRIYEYMRRLGAPRRGGLYNHMQLQPVFTISRDGTSAQVRSRLLVMFAQGENRAQWGEAIYENTFVRENGVWKYKNLHAYQTFYANYEEGWAKHTAGMFSPFANYPPDMPQSVPYKEYPAVFVAPFHYKHPVTGK